MPTEIRKVNEPPKAWHWNFYCQWKELVSSQNWYNFDLIHFGLEWGTYSGRYVEGRIALLGIVIDFEWIDKLQRAAFVAKLDGMVADHRQQQGEEGAANE